MVLPNLLQLYSVVYICLGFIEPYMKKQDQAYFLLASMSSFESLKVSDMILAKINCRHFLIGCKVVICYLLIVCDLYCNTCAIIRCAHDQ